jgi:disulfide bond formation protein DsbB
MAFLFRPRIWFLFVAVSCASMLGYGLYVQHVLFIDPCPLCVLQRLAFIWIGLVGLLAAIHNPGQKGRWTYAILLSIGGITGAGIAGRHVWLQSLPPELVPGCGMGLNYMLETMPFGDVLKEVFYGSGECAEVDWSFLGLSMPNWGLLWYIGFTVVTLFVVIRAGKNKV